MRESGYYWVKLVGESNWSVAFYDNGFSTKEGMHQICDARILTPDEENPLLKAQAILDSMLSAKAFVVNFLGEDFPKPVFPDGYIPGFTEYVKVAYPTGTTPMDIKVKHYINFVNGLTH